MDFVLWLGWVAAVTATLVGLPQAVRLWKTRRWDGVSAVNWELRLACNLGWFAHGLIIGQWNIIVTNILAALISVVVLWLLYHLFDVSLVRTLGIGVVVGAAMIVGDIWFGSAAFGLIACVPSLIGNCGQSVDLVRSRRLNGVSPAYLSVYCVNQVLWLSWGMLVHDSGTAICSAIICAVVTFNMAWYLLRYAGVPAFHPRPEPAGTWVTDPRGDYDEVALEKCSL
ncbi:MAG: hypothetical protein LBR58_07965 [Propionibacteriaceae bacterium]|jgi:uncharacterized protein with PQ loop repeat|nr:hypothetical protein [Propionibacteriaceae bacterium]